jgi:hypothetical protein
MKRLSIILAIAALAVSCLDLEQKTELTFETNSTVNAYFKFIRVESGKLPLHTIMVADMNTEQMIIMLSLVGSNTGSIYDVIDNPNSDKAKAFTAAQQKYGDFNPTPSLFRYYTKRKGGGEWHLESGNCIYYAFSEQIAKITITSNVAWSDDYPAGKDLSPLFTAEFGSLSNYIKNGHDDNSYITCKEVVSDLTAAHFAPMLESDWNIYGGTDLSLSTMTLPEDYTQHTITIALTLDTGEVIEYTDRLVDIMLW